ncbi:unnamed protein product [Brachionus calyciflorus]|uniref:ethanolamine kinase n=1 Tax=Brachionus calyciflorus TaxID=104777 RepID=A0A814A4D7_9BILA|nr:unnamed protein product [Brachionus calyciflorus]
MSDSEYDIEITSENLRDSVLKIALDIKPEWRKYSEDNFILKFLNGGVTNRLVSCYLKENGLDTPQTILFRIYGKNTEHFISREEEIETMKIMKKVNLGPEYYTKFKNGISYEYLPGKIVDFEMVNDLEIYPKIAKAFASLHLINFKGFIRHSDLEPGQKTFIFPKIREILNLVHDDYKAHMSHMTDDLLAKIPNKKQLLDEVNFLENYFKNLTEENESIIVFSHNDLLLANIIFNEQENNVKFIDYEYAGINYQAYDIANHFNEYAGVENPDYSKFPQREYQLKWLRIYLDEFYSKVNKFYTRQSDETVLVDDKFLNQFCDEVNKFTLVSHLMWAIWSLVQAQSSDLEFNFVEYSHIRFNEYFKGRTNLLNL